MDSPVIKKPRFTENSLRDDVTEVDTIDLIKKAWLKTSSDFTKNDIEVIHKPFPVCIIKNFIRDIKILQQAAEEVANVAFNQKSNDLYEFKQTEDVKNLTNYRAISQLYEIIRVEGRKLVNNIVGMTLNTDISATFSSYGYQDRLLCHDDKCEDRHIAFILYLVDDWCEDDGGSLDLFSTDSNGYPLEIVRSINPQFNMMVFFEVTHSSFHQVSEVKSKTKNRLSINGWFHSPQKQIEKPNSTVILQIQQNLANDKEFKLEEYFSYLHFGDMNQTIIKKIFINKSQIQLEEFIAPEFLEQIKTELRSKDIVWISKGPVNIRKYELADFSAIPNAVLNLKEIFESKCWFSYLKSITALDLSPSVTSDLEIWERGIPPYCSFELQRWTHGCYTLIHDQDPEFHSEALDVILRIPYEDSEDGKEENDELGAGHIIYIDSASEDEECLLHIGYKMNSLGLVFRDKETLRFTKYLDSSARPFYQILCTYRQWRPPVNEPDLKHCDEDDSSDSVVSSEECISTL